MPFSSPGDLTNPGIEPRYPVSQADSLSSEQPRKPLLKVKRLPAMQETWVRSLGQEDTLEKKMATHFSILA